MIFAQVIKPLLMNHDIYVYMQNEIFVDGIVDIENYCREVGLRLELHTSKFGKLTPVPTAISSNISS